MSCVEKKFELQDRKWEEYKDTRHSEGDSALTGTTLSTNVLLPTP
jgi:hypothetical protein